MWSVFFSEQLIFDRALLGFTLRARSTEADGVYRRAERPRPVAAVGEYTTLPGKSRRRRF
jgi:hypothetical protein